MSREAYQIPVGSGSGSPAMGGGAGSGTNYSRAILDPAEGASIHYICGDCGTKFPLRRNDTIRCKECGCRVLYKERTKR